VAGRAACDAQDAARVNIPHGEVELSKGEDLPFIQPFYPL